MREPSVLTKRAATASQHGLTSALTVIALFIAQLVNGYPGQWISAGFQYLGQHDGKEGPLTRLAYMVFIDIVPVAILYGFIFLLVWGMGAVLSSSVAHGVAQARDQNR